MADIDSSLPIRTITPGDTLVGLLDDANARINPATEETAATLATEAGNIATVAGDTTTIAGDTTSIDGKLPTLGQKDMAGSVPVVIANNQTSIPVHITSAAVQTPVVQYETDVDVIPGNTLVNTYAPATVMTLNRIWASGSGRIKVEVFASLTADIDLPASLRWVSFNSTSNPNVDIDCSDYKILGTDTTEWTVKVVVTNIEAGKNQNLYSTIVGNL